MKKEEKLNKDMAVTWMASTPVGPLMLVASETGLARLEFISPQEAAGFDGTRNTVRSRQAEAILQDAVRQVEEYLAGKRRQFDLPLDLPGPPTFNRRALEAAVRIPYGQVITYGQLAASSGNPRAPRAAGAAMAHNPIALVIPCHRVVDASMHLHGFGSPGGLKIKAWLLEREGLRVEDNHVMPAA